MIIEGLERGLVIASRPRAGACCGRRRSHRRGVPRSPDSVPPPRCTAAGPGPPGHGTGRLPCHVLALGRQFWRHLSVFLSREKERRTRSGPFSCQRVSSADHFVPFHHRFYSFFTRREEGKDALRARTRLRRAAFCSTIERLGGNKVAYQTPPPQTGREPRHPALRPPIAIGLGSVPWKPPASCDRRSQRLLRASPFSMAWEEYTWGESFSSRGDASYARRRHPPNKTNPPACPSQSSSAPSSSRFS
jgi:hypothetical protein